MYGDTCMFSQLSEISSLLEQLELIVDDSDVGHIYLFD